MDKYSDSYSEVSIEKNPQLVIEINQHVDLFYKKTYQLVQMPTGNIGIRIRISTGAGSDSLLIQHEPVVIEICGEDINHCKLNVYPDRKNFPFDFFPHINFPVIPMQSSLCLTREDFGEWYAEHTFADYLELVHKWFKDANNGNLIKIKDEDFYEPFRVNNPDGILLRMPYEDIIIEKLNTHLTRCFSVANRKDGLYYCNIMIPLNDATEVGVLLCRPAKDICNTWFINRPKTLGELYSFFDNNNFNPDKKAINEKIAQSQEATSIFFHIAFKRPTKILEKTTSIDFLTFKVSKEDYVNNKLDSKVSEVLVMDIANIDLARHLSATSDKIADKKILLLGCGAIGSKLAYHLYRSGICDLTICDKDIMLSHNVFRHALTNFNFCGSKVKLIKKELDGMYACNLYPINTIEEDINDWLPKAPLKEYDLIIDATASASVFRCVDELSPQITCPIIHFALSDSGKIGLVYIRSNKSSLLSDYYMQLARLAIEDEDLSKWLHNERNYNYDWVRIGEGCHSNTMILSDDVISSHTAIASSIIRHLFDENLQNIAYLSFANIEYIGQMFTDKFVIPPFNEFKCDNDEKWHVRIPSDLLQDIRHQTKIAGNKEVGGYMMGNVDEKHKTIYVLHHYKPSDSKQKSTKLHLGVRGWKEEYKKIKEKTASMLEYIGDWHSHPKGALNMSTIDVITNYAIKTEEIPSKYGLCMITNSSNTKVHLLYPNVNIILVKK